ncbi:hypothetical protein [Azohydromonas caseinilytica]|uniref:Uncharacterized protein n=1 Tax=Azohydromonas caseinilytica TaxID=2728836 RepID=A0A848FD81_9BURK|nr:hypothetical protein [Azohydromonas caseinilytica]NML18167.1 hypothetical protein [Azohydromonas caseinilytica]
MQLFGFRLVGINEVTGHKLLLTLILIAVLALLGLALAPVRGTGWRFASACAPRTCASVEPSATVTIGPKALSLDRVRLPVTRSSSTSAR